MEQEDDSNLYLVHIFFACLSVWVQSVRLYTINVKTAKPIGPKFCVEPHMTPGKVYGFLKLQKIVSKRF